MHQKAEQGIYPSNAPLRYIYVVYDGKRLIALDPKDHMQSFSPSLSSVSQGITLSAEYLEEKAYREGLIYRKTGRKIPKSVVYSIFEKSHVLRRISLEWGNLCWYSRTYRIKRAF